jgi:hypothetical protein
LLLYYSRARFTTLLLPLLQSFLPAHVISVFGPGRDESSFPEDLSLRDPKKYGFMSSGWHAAYLKTFYFEYLAAKYPGKLALCHYFPGLIIGEGFSDAGLPWWFRAYSSMELRFSNCHLRRCRRRRTGRGRCSILSRCGKILRRRASLQIDHVILLLRDSSIRD